MEIKFSMTKSTEGFGSNLTCLIGSAELVLKFSENKPNQFFIERAFTKIEKFARFNGGTWNPYKVNNLIDFHYGRHESIDTNAGGSVRKTGKGRKARSGKTGNNRGTI